MPNQGQSSGNCKKALFFATFPKLSQHNPTSYHISTYIHTCRYMDSYIIRIYIYKYIYIYIYVYIYAYIYYLIYKPTSGLGHSLRARDPNSGTRGLVALWPIKKRIYSRRTQYKTTKGSPWADALQQAVSDAAIESFWRCKFVTIWPFLRYANYRP